MSGIENHTNEKRIFVIGETMKVYVYVFLVSFITPIKAEKIDCEKSSASNEIQISAKPLEIDSDYIDLVARQIFNHETGIYDFVGVDCRKLTGTDKGIWNCHIRQLATDFNDGKYTINPPGVGESELIIDFRNNTYTFEK